MTQVPTSPDQTDPKNGPQSAHDADDLAHLFKMSKTAGVGTSEYVAINAWAIFALVMGLASLLTLLGTRVFLVLPLVGTVASFIALRQILRSNGTQGGQSLAAVGLVLSLGIASFVITREATVEMRTRADREALAQLTDELEKAVLGNRFDQAYLLFMSDFHLAVDESRFSTAVRSLRESNLMGELQSIELSDRIHFSTGQVTGMPVANGVLNVKTSKNADPQAVGVIFIQDGSTWMFRNIPDLFPSQTDGPPQPPI